MYETFYGLEEKPFSLLPDPEFLFLTRQHQMALTLLEYGISSQAGFTVITGEIGSGKTTLIRKLLKQLQQDNPSFVMGVVNNTQCNGTEELLRWILFALELECPERGHVALYNRLTRYLVQQYTEGRRVILIIDEAQQSGPQLLEQIRMISNINADKHQLVQFILVGQPDLRDLLKRPELEQFAQRIIVDYHLKPLKLEETTAYITHRLQVAGGKSELFTPECMEIIWTGARGIPRLINLICDTALVYGFSEQKPVIDAEVVQEVLEDREIGLAPLSKQAGTDNRDVSNEGENNMGMTESQPQEPYIGQEEGEDNAENVHSALPLPDELPELDDVEAIYADKGEALSADAPAAGTPAAGESESPVREMDTQEPQVDGNSVVSSNAPETDDNRQQPCSEMRSPDEPNGLYAVKETKDNVEEDTEESENDFCPITPGLKKENPVNPISRRLDALAAHAQNEQGRNAEDSPASSQETAPEEPIRAARLMDYPMEDEHYYKPRHRGLRKRYWMVGGVLLTVGISLAMARVDQSWRLVDDLVTKYQGIMAEQPVSSPNASNESNEPNELQTPTPETAAEPTITTVPEPKALSVQSVQADSTLEIRLSETCWVVVTDGEDKQLHYGLAEAGKELTFQGKPPFSLIVGNVPAAQVTFDGRQVALESYMNEDRVARLTLGDDAGEAPIEPLE